MTIKYHNNSLKIIQIKNINLFSIINQNERFENDELKIGILLGHFDKNESIIQVESCFAIDILHENIDENNSLDENKSNSDQNQDQQNQHHHFKMDQNCQDTLPILNNNLINQLFQLHLRVNPSHIIVGWYHIGNDLDENWIKSIHLQIQEETIGFDAIHLHVDMDLLQVATEFPLHFSIAAKAGLPTTPDQDCEILFLPVPHEVVGESTQFRDGSALTRKNTSNMQSLADSIKTIHSLITTLHEYTTTTMDPVNLETAQVISDAVSLLDTLQVPLINPDIFKRIVKDRHEKDLEMIDQLSFISKRLVQVASALQIGK